MWGPGDLKPVGRMSSLGEFDLPGWLLGASSDAHSALQKQGLRAPGSELLRQNLGIPWTEKWPKTGHADDWVCCDWV